MRHGTGLPHRSPDVARGGCRGGGRTPRHHASSHKPAASGGKQLMLILVLCVVALASPALFGGKLSRLAFVRFRGWWILVAALLAQILIIEVFPDADRTFLEAVHMVTYVAAGVFVAINWRIPGLIIIAVGGAMNGVTIALNGGQLPASKGALQMAGIDVVKG